MADDFGYCWRTVRLYCPAAPTFLAREWVNAAWKQLLAARHWGFLRKEITITTGPVDTLNNPYLVDQYLTTPADFGSWKVIVDPSRQVRISFNHSLEDLAKVDPGRTTGGPIMALVAATPWSDPALPSVLGRARYLYYPYTPAVPGAIGSISDTWTTLTAVYHTRPDRLDDTSVFPGILATAGEVLVAGALAQAALWPGTPDKPNPYFNAGLAQTKANEFRIGIQSLSLRDDEQYPDDLWDSWPETCDCLDGGGDPRTTDASGYYGATYY